MSQQPTPNGGPALSWRERDRIEQERRDALLALPNFTLVRVGERWASGDVQGQIYWRLGDGLGPTGRDTNTRDQLRRAVQTGGWWDRPWALEVLAEPARPRKRQMDADRTIDGGHQALAVLNVHTCDGEGGTAPVGFGDGRDCNVWLPDAVWRALGEPVQILVTVEVASSTAVES